VKQSKHQTSITHTSLARVLWKAKEIFAFSAKADAKQMLCFLLQGLLRYKAESNMSVTAGEVY